MKTRLDEKRSAKKKSMPAQKKSKKSQPNATNQTKNTDTNQATNVDKKTRAEQLKAKREAMKARQKLLKKDQEEKSKSKEVILNSNSYKPLAEGEVYKAPVNAEGVMVEFKNFLFLSSHSTQFNKGNFIGTLRDETKLELYEYNACIKQSGLEIALDNEGGAHLRNISTGKIVQIDDQSQQKSIPKKVQKRNHYFDQLLKEFEVKNTENRKTPIQIPEHLAPKDREEAIETIKELISTMRVSIYNQMMSKNKYVNFLLQSRYSLSEAAIDDYNQSIGMKYDLMLIVNTEQKVFKLCGDCLLIDKKDRTNLLENFVGLPHDLDLIKEHQEKARENNRGYKKRVKEKRNREKEKLNEKIYHANTTPLFFKNPTQEKPVKPNIVVAQNEVEILNVKPADELVIIGEKRTTSFGSK